jgi:type IV fimbrial biogenesis protein FimT
MSQAQYKPSGFALIELLAILSLTSFMIGIAVIPAYQQWRTQVRLETKAQQLLSELKWARNIAVRNGKSVIVCSSHDKKYCGGQWEKGWLIIAKNGRGLGKRLRYTEVNSDLHIIWKGTRHLKHVQFNPKGTTAGYSGYFMLCQHSPNLNHMAWQIDITQAGRIQLKPSRAISQCYGK